MASFQAIRPAAWSASLRAPATHQSRRFASKLAAAIAATTPPLPTPQPRRRLAPRRVMQSQPSYPRQQTASVSSSAPATTLNEAASSIPEPVEASDQEAQDWANSFHGLATAPFDAETAAKLMAPINAEDVEIKPDGIVYLPEIKYRRILNAAFGPGGWGLAPRSELAIGEKNVTREYALVAHGRFVAQARGEMQYFNEESIPTAGEGCKSNAMMRCCKDLGVASELWDPRWIRAFKKSHCQQVWAQHATNKNVRQFWVLKDGGDLAYPWQIKTNDAPAAPAASAAKPKPTANAAKAPIKKAVPVKKA